MRHPMAPTPKGLYSTALYNPFGVGIWGCRAFPGCAKRDLWAVEYNPCGVKTKANRSQSPREPEYILRLVGQGVKVSFETVQIVGRRPEKYSDA